MTIKLINKIDIAFKYYTGWSLYDENPHFYIDSNELNESFMKLIDFIGEDNSSMIYIKEDMPLKVIVLKNHVIRVCLSPLYYKKYEKIFNFIKKWDHPNLENIDIIRDIGKYIIIVSKKVEPLVIDNNINKNVNIDYDKLYFEIISLINDFKDIGAVHGDVSLDNIGYDKESDRYILFDYDNFKIDDQVESLDIYKFGISLKFYMNRK